MSLNSALEIRRGYIRNLNQYNIAALGLIMPINTHHEKILIPAACCHSAHCSGAAPQAAIYRSGTGNRHGIAAIAATAARTGA